MAHPASVTLSPEDRERLAAVRARYTIATLASEADVSVSTCQRLARGDAANRATVRSVLAAVAKLEKRAAATKAG